MAAAISKKRKKPAVREINSLPLDEEKQPVSSRVSSSLFSWKNGIIIAILIITALLWVKRGIFIAATVNGQPISRWSLVNQLEKRFGDQILDNLINERLILSAARQKGIFVTSDEIETKVKEIEKQIEGSYTLDEALKLQGLSRDEFKKQIEIQLSIDKMFEGEATVSAGEVDDYIKKNEALYKNSTEPAKVKDEVYQVLKQQKTADLFNTWFSDVKQKASIKKFL